MLTIWEILIPLPNSNEKQAVACISNRPRAWLRHTPYLRITRNFKILKCQVLLFNLIKIMQLKESVYLNILKSRLKFQTAFAFVSNPFFNDYATLR